MSRFGWWLFPGAKAGGAGEMGACGEEEQTVWWEEREGDGEA